MKTLLSVFFLFLIFNVFATEVSFPPSTITCSGTQVVYVHDHRYDTLKVKFTFNLEQQNVEFTNLRRSLDDYDLNGPVDPSFSIEDAAMEQLSLNRTPIDIDEFQYLDTTEHFHFVEKGEKVSILPESEFLVKKITLTRVIKNEKFFEDDYLIFENTKESLTGTINFEDYPATVHVSCQ